MEIVKVNVAYNESNFGAGCKKYACVATGKTLAEVKRNLEEALEFHFEGMREDLELCPAIGEYSIEYELTTQALLAHYKTIVSLTAISNATGINKGLLSHYITGFRNPRPSQRQKIIKGIHSIGKELTSVC